LKILAPRLDQSKGELGEMIIIDLDNNEMETRGMNPVDVVRRIPDLFRNAMTEQGVPSAQMSASDMLAQDLVDLLKVDKRTLYGESTLTNVSETAAKATKAVKSGFLKLKNKGKQFLSKASASNSFEKDDVEQAEGGPVPPSELNTLLPDFIYTQGSQNEIAEEEARIAFTSFFLSMFGNMRWYLSANPGKLPQLDRKRFLQQKQAMGEGENTPIWPLLQNFCQTQMLEEFAKSRVEEVRTRQPVTLVSPLFSQCANYHRLHSIDFSVVNVRRVARQVAQSNPSRPMLQTSARRMAMLLTSNRTFEGDYNKAVAQLVDHCRECSSVLFDVMSVIWVRMRDCKGIHWKHAYQSLQILRNLLYHGPLAAVAEATDGLDKIRLMKFYNDNMRSQICTQIRQAASQVYSLLVDRSKLYSIRRLCINKRRTLRKADPGVVRSLAFGLYLDYILPLLTQLFAPPVSSLTARQGDKIKVYFAFQDDSYGLEPTASLTGSSGPCTGTPCFRSRTGFSWYEQSRSSCPSSRYRRSFWPGNRRPATRPSGPERCHARYDGSLSKCRHL
jgi:hypothetical protein